jgi:hypothetical protein
LAYPEEFDEYAELQRAVGEAMVRRSELIRIAAGRKSDRYH